MSRYRNFENQRDLSLNEIIKMKEFQINESFVKNVPYFKKNKYLSDSRLTYQKNFFNDKAIKY